MLYLEFSSSHRDTLSEARPFLPTERPLSFSRDLSRLEASSSSKLSLTDSGDTSGFADVVDKPVVFGPLLCLLRDDVGLSGTFADTKRIGLNRRE